MLSVLLNAISLNHVFDVRSIIKQRVLQYVGNTPGVGWGRGQLAFMSIGVETLL